MHDIIRAKKRIYMTATPRVYRSAAAAKARASDYTVYSMDDRGRFGRELYRLGFSEAIDKKLLSDYRVLVLGVSEKYAASVMHKITESTGEAGDINLTDTARMVGIYKAFQNPGKEDAPNVQTAIVYTNRIRDSKNFAATFKKLDLDARHPFHCDAQHVDGSQNASVRAGALQWLRDSTSNPNECRILTNARCLSEGVDVPALDSICFTNPRTSEVDIIQAVGRVMRKADNKDYGYVIVPIAIPEGGDPTEVLDNKEAFNTIWSVLRALRSHDERMDIDVNTADIRKRLPGKISWIGIDRDGNRRDAEAAPVAVPLASLDIPNDAIFAKIVDEVGDRQYFEHWARDVAQIAPQIQERIASVLDNEKAAKTKFDGFMSDLREIIHDGLADWDGIEMLAQHMITRRIFDSMFGTNTFSKSNPVSVAITGVVEDMRAHGLDTELRDLEKFYQSIEKRIANLDTHDARQQVISEMYGTFFKTAFPKMAERLGVVYTPVEVVDFILRSVEYVLQDNFGKGLTDKNVNIIDPFTGAGTFLSRLLAPDTKLVSKKDVKRKYDTELFANEIILLAYYIASVNLESAYGQRTDAFKQFEGLSLTDTFNRAKLDEYAGDIMAKPKKEIRRQRKANITVIVGNPPYSAGQSNYNDQNQNVSYPSIDKRIQDTYAAHVRHIGAAGKAGLRDSYIRSIRWSSDRIGESGIIGFVTNGSFIRSEAAAGVRACLQQEFTDVWVFDLRGNQRTQGEVSKKEGGKVFGSGSRAPVAITILVKNSKKNTPGTIHYHDIGDYHTREAKLDIIKTAGSIKGIEGWQTISPDKHHDWLGQRNRDFDKYLQMGSKDAKKGKENAIFSIYSNGLGTSRDVWTYNSSKNNLSQNMKIHINYCNKHGPKQPLRLDPTQVKWTPNLTNFLRRTGKQKFTTDKIRRSSYRPFFFQYLYFDKVFNERSVLMHKLFPENNSKNITIIVPYKITEKFSVFVSNTTADSEVVHHGQCFPLYAYDGNGVQRDNIMDSTLDEYRKHYEDDSITKQDIFWYVYGLLHHEQYRSDYQNNLTRELPRIPMASDFTAFSKTGKELADLHLSYETCKRYDLGKPVNTIPNSPRKIRWGRQKKDTARNITSGQNQHVLIIDDVPVYENLPVCEYRVNGRTPLGWFVDRYGHTVDKESGITNYPLQGVSGKEVRAIIERLAYVGAESDRLVSQLPKEFEPKNWSPTKTGLEAYVK